MRKLVAGVLACSLFFSVAGAWAGQRVLDRDNRHAGAMTRLSNGTASPTAGSTSATGSNTLSPALRALKASAQADGTVPVIVGLRVPFAPEGELTPSEVTQQRADIASVSALFRASYDAAFRRNPDEYRSLEFLPYVTLRVTAQEVDRLAADPLVVTVEADEEVKAQLDSGGAAEFPREHSGNLTLINADQPAGAPYTGTGQTVVVLDQGVDRDHDFLRGKIVKEYCFRDCIGGPAPLYEGSGASNPCLNGTCGEHGMHVAGIVAGSIAGGGSGVAPGANVISIRVLNNQGNGRLSDFAAAFDLINRLKVEQGIEIAAVNFSVGVQKAWTPGYEECDDYSRSSAAALRQLRASGIPLIAASGNYYDVFELTWPACRSDSISVGAVRDSGSGDPETCERDPRLRAPDSVACFSNSSETLSLLAPGVNILSSVADTADHNRYKRMSGTSMAAPHVAGAWAVIKQKAPTATIPEVLNALRDSGTPVVDWRLPDRITPRINLTAALDRFNALSYAKTGPANGKVTRSTAQRSPIASDGAFKDAYLIGTSVTLEAAAAEDSRFDGWSGDCAGQTGPICTLVMTEVKNVTATFVPKTVDLDIAVRGTGDIRCNGGPCQEAYPAGTPVTLAATPEEHFASWDGCARSSEAPNECIVVLSSPATVTATFAPPAYGLTVEKSGYGNITCNVDCAGPHPPGSVVFVTASPDSGWSFGGTWEGCTPDPVDARLCRVTMSGPKTVKAVFRPYPIVTVRVGTNGPGSGTIQFTPPPLQGPTPCGENCLEVGFPAGTDAAIIATPNDGSSQGRWQGPCSFPSGENSRSCAFRVSSTTREFSKSFLQSAVVKLQVNGQGSIQAGTNRIGTTNCEGSCQVQYDPDQVVVFVAPRKTGWTFSSWGGDCAASASGNYCELYLSAFTYNVTANFSPSNLVAQPLQLRTVGSGHITVKSPQGIPVGECNPSAVGCSQAATVADTPVTLTAVPASGWHLSGWIGCSVVSGTNDCSTLTNAARTVTATFTSDTEPRTLQVTTSGPGSISFTSPPGLNPTNCQQVTVNDGTRVTIAANPQTGASLAWTGACSGTGTCVVDMRSNQAVGANFTLLHQLQVTTSGLGTVNFPTATVSCGDGCRSMTANRGDIVELNAVPQIGWRFSRWTNCTSVSADNVCKVAMSGERSVTATFVADSTARTLQVRTTGPGSVSFSLPSNLVPTSCGTNCRQVTVSNGTEVTIIAAPGRTERAVWSGSQVSCDTTGKICKIAVTAGELIDVNFLPSDYALNIVKTSGGTVTCNGGVCSARYPVGTTVSIDVRPTGNNVVTWSGECSGSAWSCLLEITKESNVRVEFAPPPAVTRTVTFSTAGPGRVSITSPNSLVSRRCADNCREVTVDDGTLIVLSAATIGSGNVSWSGACTGTSTTCSFIASADARTTATFTAAPATYDLTYTKAGTGTGSVTINGAACGTSCTKSFTAATQVTLTASQADGSTFTGWSGACTGAASCTVTMDAAKAVTATFTAAPATYDLTYTKGGTGTGSVTINGEACGESCTKSFTAATQVTLTATALNGGSFTGWSGACTGAASCTVTMDAAKAVTATFTAAPATYDLTYTKGGTGTGSVTINGAACGESCTKSFTAATQVTLTATALNGGSFTGWSGACTGAASCTVTMDAAKAVTATFTAAPATYDLTYTKAGTGTGSVTINGAACGTSCTKSFTAATQVTLTATALNGGSFTGWSGACTGAASCTVTMDAAKAVTATFTAAPATYDLTYTKAGTGTGSVTINGAACGTSCTKSFTAATQVTLTATALNGGSFTGWSGACTGAASCTVTMDAAKAVTATFTAAPATYDLTYTKAGTGTGSVTINGEACGESCTKSFTAGTSVTLTASQADGSTFTGWSGACTGAAGCTVTMDAAKAVTATFTAAPATYDLTYTKAGTGTGSVTINGAACGTSCTKSFTAATQVTLTATALNGGSFTGWSGACTGAASCTVTMDAAKAVTATFTAAPATYDLTYTKGGTGTGSVTINGAACGESCTKSFTAATQVTLTATALNGGSFTGWSGACTGAASCTVTMDAAKAVTATFTAAPATYDLTYTKAGTGTGSVTINGAACGTSCTKSFTAATQVTLTATALNGGSFTGWSGACTGAAGCTVTMDAAKAVTATFTAAPATYDLTYTKAGTGTGSVTINGAACGTSCTKSFTAATQVTLTATALNGGSFTGWSGACTGAASCTVTMDAAKAVTATFTAAPATYDLTYTKAGTGTGSVTINGAACGTSCTKSFTAATQVTLTASQADGSTFTGWSGACTGAASCTVTMDAAKAVTATFTAAPATYDLTYTKGGTGTGSVTINGEACGESCTKRFTAGTSVTLTASQADGSTFTGWSGACTGAAGCTVTMDAAKAVTATFTAAPAIYDLTYTKAGTGTGSVTINGEACGTSCTKSFTAATQVTLTASQADGSTFTGWSGACTGAASCTVTMDAAKAVTATFTAAPATYDLTYTKAGTGTGSVTINGAACGTSCTKSFTAATQVTLTATALNGGSFTGWSGACTGAAGCTVTMDAAKAVTATFTAAPATYDLTYTKAGTGTGSVTINGAACGTSCTKSFTAATQVTLTATALNGGSFTGWSGACTGAASCTVTMDAAKAVTATFTAAPATYDLTYTKAGTGTGSVTINGAACGTSCTKSFTAATQVTLTASQADGSTFTGWSGACTGAASCTVTMDAAKAVTATFTAAPATYDLTYTKGGTGTGSVTINGEACGESCTKRFTAGTSVTLTASQADGSTFTGWSGACTGAAGCTVTMDAAKAVTATFTAAPAIYDLTYTKAGTGTGSVTINGEACGTSCTKSFTAATQVTLTASQADGSTFTGWSGACTGAASCTVTMDAAKAVTATFTAAPAIYDLTYTKAGTGSGSVTINGAACGTSCTKSFTAATQVTLTATALNGGSFTGWSGACTGAASCTVTMDAAKAVTATFTAAPATYDLTYTKAGTGTGSVTINGAACGTSCTKSFTAATQVTLTATALNGGSFTGWSGACTGAASCTVTMDAAKAVTATFTAAPATYDLTYTKAGAGTGSVTINGEACGESCTKSFTAGTSVTLTASQADGSTFTGWGEACEGVKVPECIINMDGDRTVTAQFVPTYSLALGVSIGGTIIADYGQVTQECSEQQCSPVVAAAGTDVTLSYRASGEYAFGGWTGGCDSITGNGYCQLKLNSNRTISASFVRVHSLTYGSNGGGFVRPNIAGAYGDCSSSCSNSYKETDTVILQAIPESGYEFSSWTGDCAGTAGSSCSVAMDRARNAAATFTAIPKSWTLQVLTTGSGAGDTQLGGLPSNQTVSDCGTNCKQVTVREGTRLTVDASAREGSSFSGWSGNCASIDGARCTVVVNQASSVTATFVAKPQPGADGNHMAYTKGGNGEGTVRFSPGADVTSCSNSCLVGAEPGLRMRMTAEAAPGSVFVGWSGICKSSKKTCVLKMKSGAQVTAIFRAKAIYQLSYVPAGTGSGSVSITPLPQGTSCAAGCNPRFEEGTRVVLQASPDDESTFEGWSGACRNRKSRCIVRMNEARQVTATFTPRQGAESAGFMAQ